MGASASVSDVRVQELCPLCFDVGSATPTTVNYILNHKRLFWSVIFFCSHFQFFIFSHNIYLLLSVIIEAHTLSTSDVWSLGSALGIGEFGSSDQCFRCRVIWKLFEIDTSPSQTFPLCLSRRISQTMGQWYKTFNTFGRTPSNCHSYNNPIFSQSLAWMLAPQ